eukprot:g4391.t1
MSSAREKGSKMPKSMGKFRSHSRVWHDREIRFDVVTRSLRCRPGEFEIDSINSVEDTKGLIWASHKQPSTNLSIGLNCITSISIKSARSQLKGSTQALFVMTRHANSRFEFVFTSLVKQSPRMFTTVQAISRAYETSKLYRDLKLRGAIIRDKTLALLPKESVFSKIGGVWNLSSDQGNLGSFFITNVRLVWHANLAENFNVSIPYMQIKNIRVRSSRFGPALVVETRPGSGGYLLGFRLDPPDRLDEVYSQIESLYGIYSKKPFFGVEFTVEKPPDDLKKLTVKRVEDGTNEEGYDVEHGTESLASYFADEVGNLPAEDRIPKLNKDLGLAMEVLPEPYTVGNLWKLF